MFELITTLTAVLPMNIDVTPNDSGLPGIGQLRVIVGAVINMFVGSTAGMMAISTLCVGVFSLFMLYDLKRIVDGGETNYIMATLALYLDLFNVFQGLLMLLGMGNSD